MKKLITILLILLNTTWASSTAGSFMDNPTGVRSLALGNCAVTLIDSSAAYKNPAALELYNRQSVYLMQGKLLNEVNYLDLSYTQPQITKYKLGFAFTLLNSSVAGIKEATYDSGTGTGELTGKELGYNAGAYIFSFSKDFGNKFFLGTNLKLVQESLAGESSNGAGLDLGLLYKYNDKLLIGISAINLAKPTLKWSTGSSNQVNSRTSIGFTYYYDRQLTLFSEFENIENNTSRLHLGGEYVVFSSIAFRAGYDQDHLTLGTGLIYKNISVDYAYVDYQDQELGTNQYFAVSLALDSDKDLEKIEKEEVQDEKLAQAVSDERLRQEITKTFAEIKPLPLPEPQIPIAEVRPTVDLEVTEDVEVVEPIIETSKEEEVTVNIQEEYTEPFYEYNIALLSARYYEETNKLLCKVFIDNIGNRAEAITCNFRILDKNSQEIHSFESQGIVVDPEQPHAFHFTYQTPKTMLPGDYYIETQTESIHASKYQKEKYIKR